MLFSGKYCGDAFLRASVGQFNTPLVKSVAEKHFRAVAVTMFKKYLNCIPFAKLVRCEIDVGDKTKSYWVLLLYQVAK